MESASEHARNAPGLSLAVALLMVITLTACGAGGASSTESASAAASADAASTAPVGPDLCEPGDSGCIGPLAPGVYTTANLIVPLTFEVPERWEKTLDVPGSVNLRQLDHPGTSISTLPDWAVAHQGRCTPEPEPDVGRTVDDLTSWLSEHPGLETSVPERASLGGLEGMVVDIRKDPAWDGPCAGLVSLFTHRGTIANDPGWWDIADGTQMRLYLLDAGEGHTVTVHVETEEADDFDAFVDVATPVLESFEFGTPTQPAADAPGADDCSYRTEYQLAYEVPGMEEVEITCDIVYEEIAGEILAPRGTP